ncbi:hypothetical protein Tco_0260339 [Tanacetum coccineum]
MSRASNGAIKCGVDDSERGNEVRTGPNLLRKPAAYYMGALAETKLQPSPMESLTITKMERHAGRAQYHVPLADVSERNLNPSRISIPWLRKATDESPDTDTPNGLKSRPL